jgi:hypothetical protein
MLFVYRLHILESDKRLIMNCQQVRTWKKLILACFGKLFKNLPAEKGETFLEEKADNFRNKYKFLY